MKNLKFILITLMLFGSLSSFAQEDMRDKMQATKIETFHFEKDGEVITYKLKVIEKRKSRVMLSKKGNPNLEYVTKLISIDNDKDRAYDRYIVLRYKKMPNDTFKIVPTKKGFAVKVDGGTLEYLIGEATYVVENDDDDYFLVDVFDKF